jgi:hypothetical protein
MRFRVLAAFLAASVLSSAAADAAIVEDFKAEDWAGSAYTSDETGQFTHCAVYASYRNGSTLYFSYEAAESWYLSVSNDSWALTQGASYPIKFKIDRRGEIEGIGVALANNQIGLPIESDHAFIGQLRRGNQLTITLQDQDYGFELSNSNRAMDTAQACVRRHVAAGTHSPVMSGRPEDQAAAQPEQAPEPEADVASSDTDDEEPAQEPDALPSQADVVAAVDAPTGMIDARTEAGGFTAALLLRSGYPNHVILGADAIVPSDLPVGDIVWTLGDVTGSTRIVDFGTPDDIEADIVARLADQCGGASTMPVASDETHSQFRLVCGNEPSRTIQFVVVPRDRGGSYIFALVGKPGDGLAGSIAEAVYAKALGG